MQIEDNINAMKYQIEHLANMFYNYIVAPNLDNGISQAQASDTPCTGGDTDMAKRQKFHVVLPTGEKAWLTGNTISEAFANGLEKYGSCRKTQPVKCVPTVREFVETTYKPSYFPTLKPKTAENYEQYLRLNILPYLGDKKLDAVDVTTIQQFYNWMATASQHGRKKDINIMSIKRISGLTSRIFKVAQEMKLIDDTPFKKTLLRIQAESAGHHKPLPDEEIDRVKQAIPHLESDEERLYMALLAYTGIRLEELLGLQWEDVNLSEQYCLIKRAITHPKNNHYHVDTPKSADSHRTVLLPTPLVDILKPCVKDHGYILGGDIPWCYSKKVRVFDRAKKHLNIKGFNNHDFRSTFATQLCDSGMSSKQCAELLGHADTRMVERVYARARHEGNMKQLSTVELMNSKYNQS
jgi:integrase